ncbi:MAG: hypothetical protein A3F18_05655 [Legionellales bacterium RIFCSPHIGHO2_12_FULL_37_14]|nr:MAG: hypothetical protein A3F18_05655 [Legionellales bacterium RIFCSPHIGHO2_12_FULL_37_14]
MFKFGYILIAFMLISLSSCKGTQGEHITPYPKIIERYTPNELRMCSCENKCRARYAACVPICRDNCSECQAKAIKLSDARDLNYTWRERVIGKILARERNSFRDPLACTKVSCDCQLDLKNCLKLCKHRLTIKLKHRSCVDSEIPYERGLRDLLSG